MITVVIWISLTLRLNSLKANISYKTVLRAEIYESAQFLYILVAACLFAKYPKETRLDYIKRFYDATSTFKIRCPHRLCRVFVRRLVSSALAY
uniref:hypothetical protein n=1 Tax=Vibrio cholerae TaxID=666 RepID=UPI003F587F26